MEKQQKPLKRKSVFGNYLYNVAYQMATLIVNLVTAPYISRIFDASTIGINSYAASILAFFFLAETFGFGLYAQRCVAQKQGDISGQTQIFWEILFARGFLCLLIIAIYFPLCYLGVFNVPKELMIIYSIQLVATIFDITFFFQGNESFSIIAWAGIAIKTIGVICIFCFVHHNSDLNLFVFIQSMTILSSFLLLWPFLKNRIQKISFKSINPWRHFWPCFKLFLPTIAVSVSSLIDKTLIANMVPGTTEKIIDGVKTVVSNANLENGYYEEAAKIETACLTMITSLGNVMVPHNSHFAAIGDRDAITENINKSIHFVWIVGIPIFLGVIGVSTTFVPMFFGQGYEKTIYLLMLMSSLVLITGLSNVLGAQYLIPLKKDKEYTTAVVVGSLINIISSACLVPSLWAYGATIGTIIGEASILLLMLFFMRNEIKIKNIFRHSFKPIIAGTIMFCFVYPLDLFVFSKPAVWQVAVLVLIGGFVYCACIFIEKDSLVLLAIQKIKAKIKPKKETN